MANIIEKLPEFLDEYRESNNNNLSDDDLFAIFESLDSVIHVTPAVSPISDDLASLSTTKVNNKKRKISVDEVGDGLQRLSHITVERNRRKQMNEHLTVLRSLMPNFYVKRGDQASIVEGVVDYITELQQILQSLEAKKQRKVYSEVLSTRLIQVSSPRRLPLSPRILPPLINLPISPRTPQPRSPYNKPITPGYLSPTSSSTNDTNTCNDQPAVANSRSNIAQVEVRFSGPNLVLKTVSPRIPGQTVKITLALEELALEILNVDVTTIDQTMLNSFTIKIGIECNLSAEELAHQIQQTFC